MENLDEREESYRHFVRLLSIGEKSIRAFARSLLPNSNGLDDIVQDTALECWRKFDDFNSDIEDVEAFTRWACVIAKFKVLSYCRDSARDRHVYRENVIVALAETSEDHLCQRETELKSIEDCLDELDPNARRLLLSVYKAGDSVARIASETGEKQRRLYSRVNQLRTLLHDCVTKKMGEIS